MKKTLVALAVTAFAASASAATLYDNDGTNVTFGGSLRLIVEKESNKVDKAPSTGHSTLKNAGSRFNVTVKHNLADDFYALGHYETRFHGSPSNQANWGNIFTNKGYIGLGGQGHLVTFGKQDVFGDDIGQAGYDKTYDVGSSNIKKGFGVLTTSSDSAVNYKYTVGGLTVGGNYNFANASDRNAEGAYKAGYGVGAIFTQALAEGQSVTFALGYTHDDLVNKTTDKNTNKDGVYGGFKYRVHQLEVAVDGGRGVEKTGDAKKTLNFVRAGGRYDVSPVVGVYGNYSYGTVKQANKKNTAHQYMLGTDYKLHKQVITYVEGRIQKQKESKETNKVIGVGMRVFW
jgi:predicted porin